MEQLEQLMKSKITPLRYSVRDYSVRMSIRDSVFDSVNNSVWDSVNKVEI